MRFKLRRRHVAIASVGILVLLPIAVFYVAHSTFVRTRLTAWLVESLRSDYRVELTIGQLEYNLRTLSVRLRDVAVASSSHRDTPFFRAREVAIDVPWKMVRRRGGDIQIESLRLVDPAVSIRRFADGTLNLPAPRGTRTSPPIFRFGAVTLERLDVSYEDDTQPLGFETRGLSISLAEGAQQWIHGPLTVVSGPELTFGARVIRTSRFTGVLGFDGRALSFQPLDIVVPQGRVTLNGRIDRLLEAPTIDAQISANVDIRSAAMFASGERSAADDLRGAIDVKGRLSGALASPVAEVTYSGRSVRWQSVATDSLEGRARISTRDVSIDDVRARVGSGRLAARGTWTFNSGARNLSAQWRQLDPAWLRRLIPAIPVPLAATLDGEIELGSDRFDLEALKATITNRASPAIDRQGLPIDGSLTLQLDRGSWRLRESHRLAEGATTESDLHGRLAARLVESTLDGSSALRVSQPAATAAALRNAGVAVPEFVDNVRGEVSGTFSLTGRIGRPVATGTVASQSLSFQRYGPFTAAAALSADSDTLTIDRLEARQGTNTIRARGTTTFADGALRGTFDGGLNDLPSAAALVSEVPPAWTPKGVLTLTGDLAGTLRAPSVNADVDGRLSAGGLDLGRVGARVELRDKTFLARLSAMRLDLATLPGDWVGPHRIAGAVDVTGVAGGSVDRIADATGHLDVAPTDVAVDDSRIRLVEPVRIDYSSDAITSTDVLVRSGTSEVRAKLDGGAIHVVNARGEWREAIVTADGSIPANTFAQYLPEFLAARLTASAEASAVKKPGTTTAGTAQAALDIRVENITPAILEGILPAESRTSVAGRARMTARIEAGTLGLSGLKGAIDVETTPWSMEGIQFAPVRPPHFTIASGRLVADAFEWQMVERPENRLSVTGGLDLEPLRLDVRVTGQTDLRLLGAFIPDITTFGDASLDVRATGSPTGPDITGDVRVANGGLTLQDPALAVTDLRGTLRLTGTRLTTNDIHGRANSGSLSATGTFDYGSLASSSMTITGRGIGLDFPAGLQSEADADLTLRVERGQPHVSGRATVLRGEYRRPLSLVNQFLATARLRGTQPAASAGALDRLGLDIRIVTGADIEVDNNYGRFDLGADLRLLGTVARPGLTGRAEMREGGQIFLGGTSYLVDRGAIDFGNADAIVPDLNIAARTSAGGHEITLGISGTPETLATDLTADDPSLGKADIVSLLLTGRPYADVATQQATASGQQLLGLLSGEVLGVAGRAVGLDALRFERGITADLGDLGDVAGETDPAARLTLAKNLSPEVRLLLSQNLTRSGGLTWIATYQPRSNVDLRVVSRENRDRAYEVRHQVSFGAPPNATPARAAGQQPLIADVRIAGEPGFTIQELLAQLELRPGDRFDFRTWREDRDRLARYYTERGFLEARIVPRRTSGPDTRVVVEYDVQRGARTELVVTGARLTDRAVGAIHSAWAHAVFDRFLEDEAARLARIELVGAGSLEAQVSAAIDRPHPDTKRLSISIVAGAERRDRRVEFTGNQVFSEAELRERLKAQGSILEPWLDPASTRRSLQELYRASGFLSAEVRVGPVRFPTPASAVLPIAIDEGRRFRIGDLQLAGVSASRIADVRKTAGLETGRDYQAGDLDEAGQRVAAWYRSQGFSDVAVKPQGTVEATEARVVVRLDVTEGPQQQLLAVEIDGLAHTRRDVVERELQFKIGVPVDVSAWQAARKRLYDTGVFRRVEIDPVEQSPESIVARVSVEERPRWRFRYGFHLDDEAKLLGEGGRDLTGGLVAEVLDRNIFGRAASAGSTFRYERQQKLGRAFVTAPRLFGLPATTSLFVTRSRREQGDTIPIVVDTSSVTGEQRIKPTERLNVTYAYSLEQNHTFDPNADPADPFALDYTVRIARLTGTAVVDTRDDPFDARRGLFHSSSLEYAGNSLGSELRFAKYLAQQTYFRSVSRVVLASSARLGLARAFGGQDLVPSEQFLTGGANSVRGYDDDAIAGRDVLDLPIGGNAMIVLNQEVRVPLYRWIGGVGFLDAGNVFAAARAIDLSDLKIGAGLGLRVATPFALLRVDFGVPLSDRASLPRRGRWYFSIGHIF